MEKTFSNTWSPTNLERRIPTCNHGKHESEKTLVSDATCVNELCVWCVNVHPPVQCRRRSFSRIQTLIDGAGQHDPHCWVSAGTKRQTHSRHQQSPVRSQHSLYPCMCVFANVFRKHLLEETRDMIEHVAPPKNVLCTWQPVFHVEAAGACKIADVSAASVACRVTCIIRNGLTQQIRRRNSCPNKSDATPKALSYNLLHPTTVLG